jgi:hypothetical protein
LEDVLEEMDTELIDREDDEDEEDDEKEEAEEDDEEDDEDNLIEERSTANDEEIEEPIAAFAFDCNLKY